MARRIHHIAALFAIFFGPASPAWSQYGPTPVYPQQSACWGPGGWVPCAAPSYPQPMPQPTPYPGPAYPDPSGYPAPGYPTPSYPAPGYPGPGFPAPGYPGIGGTLPGSGSGYAGTQPGEMCMTGPNTAILCSAALPRGYAYVPACSHPVRGWIRCSEPGTFGMDPNK